MLQLKTRKELADEAFKLSASLHLVRYHNVTYVPADFETRDFSVPPDIDRTIWLPLSRPLIRRMAASQFDTMFASDTELGNFEFMVAQCCDHVDKDVTALLVRTADGLKELTETGELTDPSQEFRPNTLVPMLNEDQAEKDRVFGVVSGWLNSDEEAESLLSHLATCLSPGWSVVKYVLLLGEGRNGKSVMLKMLEHLFGADNISHVTRQAMSEQSPVVLDLAGKLVNIIYDGRAEYVKDSGPEKSLIAGEQVPIRRLYESASTMVRTNALFIEGLNREPKTSDKSLALQKRLVRFQFPNVYDLNHLFEKQMLSEAALGAFLSLLIDRYVKEDEISVRLAPTAKTIQLQLDAMVTNSLAFQFIKHLEEDSQLGAIGLIGDELAVLVSSFKSWRIHENDVTTWAEPDVATLFAPLVNTELRSKRIPGLKNPRKVRVVTSFRSEAAAYIESLKGDDDATIEALVDDGLL